ncbi:hypothetical protein Btru_052461 [Bulinus truncatus]|nr:hypothetical protein Btru_052461 [Bulinus truncatus]
MMKVLDQFIGGSIHKDLKLHPKDKLTPKDHLWAGILRFKYGKKKQGQLTLTPQHSWITCSDAGHFGQASRSNSNSIVFTCGHHYSEERFKTDGVNWLMSEMTASRIRLPNSASLMKHILMQIKNRKKSFVVEKAFIF